MAFVAFWKNIEKGPRALYLLLLVAVLAAVGLGFYGFYKGDQLVFPLERQAELYPAEAHLDASSPLLTLIRIEANAYLVSERYTVGAMQLPVWAVWAVLAGMGAALTFFWSIISSLKRMPFYVAIGLGMLWLATFNLDLLGIFSETGRTLLLIVLGVLGGVSYLFHSFLPQVSFIKRFLVFALLVIGLGLAIFYASPFPAEQTAMHLVNYSTMGSMVASALFLLLVAYENLHGLLWFNTQAQQPQRRFGLPQFVLISVLYLGNLLLLYLKQNNVLDLDIFLLHPFLILLCSALVGFWGLRQRQLHYSRFLRFETEAAPIYLVLALLTALNLAYALLLANDAFLKSYANLIVLTHLAYGVPFLIYVLVNFAPLIKQKLRVYKVVYEPRRLQYYTVYLMGSVILVILIMQSYYAVQHQAMAGYYTYLGDLYRQTEAKPLLAEQYYAEGADRSRTSQRARLSLLDMYHQGGMRTLELRMLENLLQQNPAPAHYLRYANLLTDQADLFAHLQLLRDGVKAFPENGPLLNNLALLYGTTTFQDSAALYLDEALSHAVDPEVVQANQLAFLLRHGYEAQAKEFANKYEGTYSPLLTNKLAIAYLLKQSTPSELPGVLKDSVLTPQSFAGFYLRHLVPTVKADTAAVTTIDHLLSQEANQPYADDLILLKGLLQQRQGLAREAKATLTRLATSSEAGAGYYKDILGQWMLQAQLYPLALQYFQEAGQARYKDAQLHGAIAAALNQDFGLAAQIALQPASAFPDQGQQQAATAIVIASQLTAEQATSAPDSLKVRFLQLQASQLPVAEVERVAQQITTPALAPVAALPLVARYVQEGNLLEAQRQLNTHFPKNFPNNLLKSQAHVLQGHIWQKAGQWKELEQTLPKLYFAQQHLGTKLYLQAQVAQRNKQSKQATNLYNQLSEKAPGHEQGQLAAASFFSAQKQGLRAYDILLEAVNYNPLSVTLRKAYIKEALQQGLKDYALQGLEGLQPLVSPTEYLTFKREIDAHLQASDSLNQSWQ
ncbi:hypothetical protein GU926_07195 [Nibribacter ruber]|uniref:Tetratricopeptide repeat protein n=1 Tax=Nibribacter ruber TaxID=2698458 RepID=A0A6P1NU16_9BACT|nr:hypothetical protein [Nibribacter ruber]QHL87227.1 hypothetical protein GU926_07195 [Nibribacter ruber]